jgi:hypothetical protein
MPGGVPRRNIPPPPLDRERSGDILAVAGKKREANSERRIMTTEGGYAYGAPVWAMWICLILAWLFFVVPIPLTVFLAIPLDIAAFVMAIICLIRGRPVQGILGLVGSTMVSILLYIVGFGGMLLSLV